MEAEIEWTLELHLIMIGKGEKGEPHGGDGVAGVRVFREALDWRTLHSATGSRKEPGCDGQGGGNRKIKRE